MEKELLEKINSEVQSKIDTAIKGLGETLTKAQAEEIVKNAIAESAKANNVSESLEELKGILKTQGEWINQHKSEGENTESKTVADAIVESLKANKILSFADLRKNKELLDQGIEVKANITTASQTGTIGRTQEVSPVRFANLRPMAFVGNVKSGTITNGKSVLMWTPANYTANTGYAGEGSNTVTENAATAQEKTRQTAKISAKQYITSETFEDLPQFAQRLQDQLTGNAMLFMDNEVLNGDGNDSTQPNHIYGIKTNGNTAFDASAAAKVEKPNLGDLVDACATQAEIALHMVDTIWIHPKTANKYRRTKASDGQYIINKLIDGTEVLGGYRVIRNSGIGDNEMIVANAQAIQLWIKRNMTMRIGQFGSTDIENDRFTAILFTRAQVLVEDEDKKAVIYVSDVNAAILAITENLA